MVSYTVNGSVLNYNQSKFYVELLDNDQHWFDDRIDDLLGSAWTDNYGKFQIVFDDDDYRDTWFEGKPELFLVVRSDSGKKIYQTSAKNPSGPNDTLNLTFDISIPEENYFVDSPYDFTNAKRIASFANIGDSLDLTDNVLNSSRLLLQTVNAWLLYTNETVWKSVGYDGPQVKRYPWRDQHSHNLKWDGD